jgi:hypothetical protein
MSDLITMMSAAAGAGGEETDPNFNQTTLLLHGDGTNGAQNNTFLDSSTNNFTITRNGNTTQGTFSPFSVADGEWSNYFSGSTGSQEALTATQAAIGTGNFTYEFWFNISSTGSNQTFVDNQNGILIYWDNASSLIVLYNRIADTTIVSGALSQNTWYHCAGVREGTGSNQTKLYIDGVLQNSGTFPSNLTGTALVIGSRFAAASGNWLPVKGYLSNLQISNSARYTSAFTPSTTPLTADGNTLILTCQSNRFVDTDSTPLTLTVVGTPSVQPFSPFLPSAAYSPSVNGGSGYFDGSGDYLTLTSNAAFAFGSGDFTVEFWYYKTAEPSTTDGLVSWNYLSGVHIGENTTGIFVWVGGTNTFATSTKILLNSWSYVAVSRSGTTARLFLNGVEVSSATSTDSVSANNLFIGASSHSATEAANGYITNVRVVKGRAVYTSAFTPPTAPLGATSGGQDPPQGTETSLLTNFTNAGIFDNTGKNNLETVADAQIDTSVKKYGTGSMEFDGTGDFLLLPASPYHNFGTGDFTIEMWLYVPTGYFQTIQRLVSTGSASPAGACYFSLGNDNGIGAGYLCAAVDLTSPYDLASGNPLLASSTLFPVATWTHVALVRSGSSVVIYQGGVSVASVSNSAVWDFGGSSGLRISGTNWSPTTENLEGFIDDLRITKGVARYTAAFTPPTAAFPNL